MKTNIILDLCAFFITVACVIMLDWTASDIIWGFWACSFCFGYAYFFTAITTMLLKTSGVQRIVMAFVSIFLLVFFTIHFGIFHYVHSIFLSNFFPLAEKRSAGLPSPLSILAVVMKSYWPLVLTTLLARWSDLPFSGKGARKNNLFVMPYANVIRMHILIFIFVILVFKNYSCIFQQGFEII